MNRIYPRLYVRWVMAGVHHRGGACIWRRATVCMCLVSRYKKNNFLRVADQNVVTRTLQVKKREKERDRVEDGTVSWNKYRIYRFAVGWWGKPDAKASRRELRAERGSEKCGRGSRRRRRRRPPCRLTPVPRIVFELRALVAQTGNGSRRMAGMT